MIASAVAIVFAPRAAIRGGTQSLAARTRSCSSVRLPGVEVFAEVVSGCAVRSRRLARVRASGVSASLSGTRPWQASSLSVLPANNLAVTLQV